MTFPCKFLGLFFVTTFPTDTTSTITSITTTKIKTTTNTIAASAAVTTPVTNTTASATLYWFFYPAPLFIFLRMVSGILSASVPSECNFV